LTGGQRTRFIRDPGDFIHGEGDHSDQEAPLEKRNPAGGHEAGGEEISRKHVKQVIETLAEVGHRELKKTGVFVLPGFAKFVVVKKAARPAREGINPFTKEKQKFAAKPASKGVRARPVKAIKDAVV
jgi:nucleoid DNA-binding protein